MAGRLSAALAASTEVVIGGGSGGALLEMLPIELWTLILDRLPFDAVARLSCVSRALRVRVIAASQQCHRINLVGRLIHRFPTTRLQFLLRFSLVRLEVAESILPDVLQFIAAHPDHFHTVQWLRIVAQDMDNLMPWPTRSRPLEALAPALAALPALEVLQAWTRSTRIPLSLVPASVHHLHALAVSAESKELIGKHLQHVITWLVPNCATDDHLQKQQDGPLELFRCLDKASLPATRPDAPLIIVAQRYAQWQATLQKSMHPQALRALTLTQTFVREANEQYKRVLRQRDLELSHLCGVRYLQLDQVHARTLYLPLGIEWLDVRGGDLSAIEGEPKLPRISRLAIQADRLSLVLLFLRKLGGHVMHLHVNLTGRSGEPSIFDQLLDAIHQHCPRAETLLLRQRGQHLSGAQIERLCRFRPWASLCLPLAPKSSVAERRQCMQAFQRLSSSLVHLTLVHLAGNSIDLLSDLARARHRMPGLHRVMALRDSNEVPTNLRWQFYFQRWPSLVRLLRTHPGQAIEAYVTLDVTHGGV
ncbi:uncharacterized protein MONBRDRAFT_9162 [Monosiga brevicollis MX1]|uniref:F-box domain-containing protein n=1 Tax=Monosiga brevicollis TaxID=81824 RepID=A9V2A1_MONBE|nr:uncharacterized protein MONBRDRAFT_9162 [Monosiga brevicollis MX1]EDQ88222.1 predicted protein [Monosiga brevicollis MX1]|eukprot:XP_001746815.1 hypothetical protein [Monosiga brevicollis MX1]